MARLRTPARVWRVIVAAWDAAIAAWLAASDVSPCGCDDCTCKPPAPDKRALVDLTDEEAGAFFESMFPDLTADAIARLSDKAAGRTAYPPAVDCPECHGTHTIPTLDHGRPVLNVCGCVKGETC